MGVKDNSLPSFLNQMQIKLKAVEQQIPPLTASPWNPHTIPSPYASLLPSLPSSLHPPQPLHQPFLIVLATELREQTGGGDGCSEVFTTKII